MVLFPLQFNSVRVFWYYFGRVNVFLGLRWELKQKTVEIPGKKLIV